MSEIPDSSADTGTTANSAGALNGRRRRVLALITLLFTGIAIAWIVYWATVLSRRETTDDAYVGGNQVTISAQKAGTVIAVMADDTQRVEAGQALVQLDPTDAQVALGQAAAALARAVRAVRSQVETAAQLDASAASRALELAQAQSDLARRAPLVAAHAIAPEELKHAQVAVDVARAALEAARRQSDAAHALLGGDDIARQPQVLEAKAQYVQAWVAARRDLIPAPVSGYVAQRGVQVGQRVSAGQALMAVVPLQGLWIDANFKEAQLRNLRLGQPARVITDVYGGGFVFHGRVIGVSAGTGSAFALLPAQNASGNWIKVVQRVPVRIGLDPAELRQHPLRIGLSADVQVATTDRSGPLLPGAPNSTPVGSIDLYAQDYAHGSAQADAIIAAASHGH